MKRRNSFILGAARGFVYGSAVGWIAVCVALIVTLAGCHELPTQPLSADSPAVSLRHSRGARRSVPTLAASVVVEPRRYDGTNWSTAAFAWVRIPRPSGVSGPFRVSYYEGGIRRSSWPVNDDPIYLLVYRPCSGVTTAPIEGAGYATTSTNDREPRWRFEIPAGTLIKTNGYAPRRGCS